ncbi:MAG: ribonuclease III [Brasilonema angustatum HA4187-MV1]|jgi:ribonuclease-3|nr:ribonuclease III [Brasilonema angustatum HA4187-MV1]
MAVTNHEQISRSFTFLNQGLYPYVKREMQKVYGERWLRIISSSMSDNSPIKLSPEEILGNDVFTLLKVIIGQWNQVFSKNLGYAEGALVSELMEASNSWAHQSHFSTEDTYRTLDTIARLLKAISAPETGIVEQDKQKVLKELFSKQAEKDSNTDKLAEIIKHQNFQNTSLLIRALTHRSYVHENPQEGEHNERLEFLGDALLTFLSGEYLYRRYPEKGEDELTRRRSALVDEKQLAKFAIEVGLDRRMRLGKGATLEGGYQNPNLLSSAFEAVVAAYYLDNNYDTEAVRAVVEPLFDSVPESIVELRSNVDSKNRFQEWVQRNITQIPPKYVTVQVGGSSHAPEFVAKVVVGNKEYGQGKGRSKKDAEKAAAENALARLEKSRLM